MGNATGAAQLLVNLSNTSRSCPRPKSASCDWPILKRSCLLQKLPLSTKPHASRGLMPNRLGPMSKPNPSSRLIAIYRQIPSMLGITQYDVTGNHFPRLKTPDKKYSDQSFPLARSFTTFSHHKPSQHHEQLASRPGKLPDSGYVVIVNPPIVTKTANSTTRLCPLAGGDSMHAQLVKLRRMCRF